MARRQEVKRQRQKKIQKRFITLFSTIGVLLVLYIVTCFMVPKDTVLEGVSINGVYVGHMKEKEAKQVVQDAFEKTFANVAMDVQVLGADYNVKLFDCMWMDSDSAAKEAMNFGHGPFITRGAAYIGAKVMKKKFQVYPYIYDDGKLREAISKTGLLDVDTTVQTTYEVSGDQLILTRGIAGYSVDESALISKVKQAVEQADFDKTIECPMLEGTVKDVTMQEVYDKLHTVAVNATLDPKKDYKIVKAVKGIDFDVDEAEKVFAGLKDGEKGTVPVKITNPEVSTKKLKSAMFRDVVGQCTTNVSGSEARISNVKLAAKKLNGKIIVAGETCSFNTTVGKRTEKAGFLSASQYHDGGTSTTVGAGIVQVASGLYKAALLANLKIKEHYNTTYVTTYIAKGFDAAVAWGSKDLKIINDSDYPVKIAASCENGVLTVKLLGTKTGKNHVEMTASVESSDFRDTEYRDDPNEYIGVYEVISDGHDGFVVQTYRKIYDENGKLLSSEKEAKCQYQSASKIVKRGTKAKPKVTTDKTSTATDKKPQTEATTEAAQ